MMRDESLPFFFALFFFFESQTFAIYVTLLSRLSNKVFLQSNLDKALVETSDHFRLN